jgi:hypothetical protein
VPKRDVLARVDRDLALGHVHPAMQRLASLVAAHPDDLELRARRAALNRQIGNLVEAGRWGFLTEEVTEAELRAFERAWPSTRTRLVHRPSDTPYVGGLHRRSTGSSRTPDPASTRATAPTRNQEMSLSLWPGYTGTKASGHRLPYPSSPSDP